MLSNSSSRGGQSSWQLQNRCRPLGVVVAIAVLHFCVQPCSFIVGLSGSQSRALKTVARLAQASKKSSGPVVDDSDFSDDESSTSDSKASTGGGKEKFKSFTSLVQEAESFSTNIERTKKKSNNLASLDDELVGKISLEEDTDLDAIMMKRARGGKASAVSLTTRLGRWWDETKEIITNPNKTQITYAVVFFTCVSILIVSFVFTFSVGGIRLQGDGVESARRRLVTMNSPFMQKTRLQKEGKRRFAEIDDIRAYNSPYTNIIEESDLNWNPPKVDLIRPEPEAPVP